MAARETEAHKRFVHVHKCLKDLGIADEQIIDLPSFKKLQRFLRPATKSPSCLLFATYALLYSIILAFLILLMFFSLFAGGLLPDSPRINAIHQNMSHFWMGSIVDRDIETEPCLLDAPEALIDLFRPLVNCSICRNVTEIKKVSGISPEDFEKNYAYTARPIIVTDSMEEWSAQHHLSFDFFKDVYDKHSPVLEGNSPECQFFPYQSEFDSLKEVFEMKPERANLSDGSKPWYIGWSNCDSAAANVLRQHYQLPYFLPPESESSKTDWIFMGSPGYGANMHVRLEALKFKDRQKRFRPVIKNTRENKLFYEFLLNVGISIDNVELPSWQAQIKGHKKWTLEPPPECYLECRPLEVIVHPGEIIVLDTNKWFHQTLILGEEMSITIGSEYD